MRMTVQVKQPFKQYLSAAPTRMFRRDNKISGFANPYIDNLQILTDRTGSLTQSSFAISPDFDSPEFCNSR